MTVDTRPLRASPHFRRVWIGRSISFFGAQLTMVAVPFAIVSGGLLTIVGGIACAALLPAFFRYRTGARAHPGPDLQGS